MKITIDIDPNRELWEECGEFGEFDTVSDAQLILWTAESDFKEFAFDIADGVLETLHQKVLNDINHEPATP